MINRLKQTISFRVEDFMNFTQFFVEIKLKKNEIWEKEGKLSEHMAFVNKGIMRQYYVKNGDEYTDNFFTEGDFLGNYVSYQTKEPSRTVTSALEPTELFVLPFKTLEAINEQMPKSKEFSQILGDQKLAEIHQRSSSLLMDTPEERYYKFIEEKPDLFNRVPQYMIAQYLGIRPESLSRIRKRHLS